MLVSTKEQRKPYIYKFIIRYTFHKYAPLKIYIS